MTLPLILFVVLLVADTGSGDRLQYNRDIRPILSENCFSCHGPDASRRKSKMRLDVREGAVARGAILPGSPEESSLIDRIRSDDPDEVMPPPGAHKMLTPQQKQMLQRWIAEGAEYQTHWAFVPPAQSPPPETRQAGAVIRNPIDAFVQARLAREGLRPSPEASRETLIRRVTLDLTGLPPTAEEVDAFLCDASPCAYEKVVDRLLNSPHYGERMAVDWLDAARYADSNGYQVDRDRELWPWRDWVIGAFNQTMGVDIAETIHAQITPEAEPESNQKASIAFDRIARAVRRTIALAQSLNTPKKPPQTRTAARKRIIRRVEDAIQRAAKGPRAESLHEELFDRIDTPEFDNELATRDINEIIQEICNDLGLEGIPGVNTWKRRTPEDIKILNEKAEAPPKTPNTAGLTPPLPPKSKPPPDG